MMTATDWIVVIHGAFRFNSTWGYSIDPYVLHNTWPISRPTVRFMTKPNDQGYSKLFIETADEVNISVYYHVLLFKYRSVKLWQVVAKLT